jgi:hypothetical protein
MNGGTSISYHFVNYFSDFFYKEYNFVRICFAMSMGGSSCYDKINEYALEFCVAMPNKDFSRYVRRNILK